MRSRLQERLVPEKASSVGGYFVVVWNANVDSIQLSIIIIGLVGLYIVYCNKYINTKK
nr:MAG TPA: hypothetical protein [Caudoviricetes sp.]